MTLSSRAFLFQFVSSVMKILFFDLKILVVVNLGLDNDRLVWLKVSTWNVGKPKLIKKFLLIKNTGVLNYHPYHHSNQLCEILIHTSCRVFFLLKNEKNSCAHTNRSFIIYFKKPEWSFHSISISLVSYFKNICNK